MRVHVKHAGYQHFVRKDFNSGVQSVNWLVRTKDSTYYQQREVTVIGHLTLAMNHLGFQGRV